MITASMDQVVFLSAESAEDKKSWLQFLARYCSWKVYPASKMDGKVHFASLGHMNAEKPNIVRTVTVRLLEGAFTLAGHSLREPDPYVVLKLGPANVAKSSVCVRTATPTWNETFVFK